MARRSASRHWDFVEPFGIVRVQDAQGRVWIENQPDPRLVLNPQIAYLVTDMLMGVVEQGTGTAAWPGRPAAAPAQPGQDALRDLRDHFNRYRELNSQGKFAEAGKELETIQRLLNK